MKEKIFAAFKLIIALEKKGQKKKKLWFNLTQTHVARVQFTWAVQRHLTEVFTR